MADANNIELAADIVAAYVSKNSVPMNELANIIASVHMTLSQLGSGPAIPAIEPPKEPAVSIKKSITDEYLICLEDGKKFKSLKRHLRSAYGMSPDQYREKWGLKPDYPMVAPAYAERRSALAKSMGLGQRRKGAGKKR